MKYRKRPVVIEAFQYDGDMINSSGKPYVPEWAISAVNNNTMYYDGSELFIHTLEGDHHVTELFIHTLEGDHHVTVGDYVIQGINGELYPCKPDIFEKTYEAV
ncbi:hypothetical protein [Blautia hydrogenotrophica]|jgi:hypothetical protein|uniref:Phage protein n=1 Tax=Blautia hydrogenotrophica (strain DSM 10507 / JCM 14656 / S5a33) TaxID=476272 RepID=C0CLN8_BLAHS|nr:hypothetical protein [Blautia hydrogenotrophica]EEG49332.1 hypothetical protein RUMHYD_01760 [Blautia hydrogenotrophica DSM 10507]MCT6798470.1 hypothetical protein [Blautia hydrogenotrophica]WPX83990.1 hypothetical protein BLHYD_19960 [Blautia hydrogenotrophica DSM 10507]